MTTPEKETKCIVCVSDVAKYRCPACDIRTCSLTCVKKHKQDKMCTGVRNKAAFVAVTNFTDTDLLSDYQFLEGAARTAETASRDVLAKQKKLPQFVQKLKEKAKSFEIDLRLMPYPMTRRKHNRTRIHKMASADASIDWMVEWIFPQADNLTIKQNVKFHSSLWDGLMEHIQATDSDPVQRIHTLRRYVNAGKEQLGLYMKAEGVPANKTRYHRLDSTATVTQNLRAKIVVEYPTVYVVLKEDSQPYEDSCLSKSAAAAAAEDSSADNDSTEEEEVNGENQKVRIAGIIVE